MALFRKFFYRKPPDGLLEISERVYVFDCCFAFDVLNDEEYKVYLGGVVSELREYFSDATFVVFNLRNQQNQSQISHILCGYEITVMDYPRHFENCPILTMEMIHHFLKSSESWLSLGERNVLLMHCDRGAWPVLAFMLAALLIYKKQFTGEAKTLDMIYKQTPPEVLQLMLPLNPVPSQLRYLQYVSRRNLGSEWPPLVRALTLDCIILRDIPNMDGEGGCRPIFRIYGPDPFMAADRTPKVLFSTPKRSKIVRQFKQADSELVKIDINCHIQGDVVLECITLDNDLEHEEMMFRIMFNTAFIRANILILNRDEIDTLWNAKDKFSIDFRAEVLFTEMNSSSSVVALDLPVIEDKGGLPIEAFAKAQEKFRNVNWRDLKAAPNMIQDTSSNIVEENSKGFHAARKHNLEESPSKNAIINVLEHGSTGSPKEETSKSVSLQIARNENLDTIPIEALSKVQEMFNNMDWLDPNADVALNMLQITASNMIQEKLENVLAAIKERKSASSPGSARPGTLDSAIEEKLKAAANPTSNSLEHDIISSRLSALKIRSITSSESSVDSNSRGKKRDSHEFKYLQSEYHSAPSPLGITALLHDDGGSKSKVGAHVVTLSPRSALSASFPSLCKPTPPNFFSGVLPSELSSSVAATTASTLTKVTAASPSLSSPAPRPPPPPPPPPPYSSTLKIAESSSSIPPPVPPRLPKTASSSCPVAFEVQERSSAIDIRTNPPPPPPPPVHFRPESNVTAISSAPLSVPLTPTESSSSEAVSAVLRYSSSTSNLCPPIPERGSSLGLISLINPGNKLKSNVPHPPLHHQNPRSTSSPDVIMSQPLPPPPPPLPPRPTSSSSIDSSSAGPPSRSPSSGPPSSSSPTSSLVPEESSVTSSKPPPPPPPPLHSSGFLNHAALSTQPAPPPPPPPSFPSNKSTSKLSQHGPPVPPPLAPFTTANSQNRSAGGPGNIPPTPAPPLGSKGKLLLRSAPKNQSQTKKASLKPYHWLKLTRAMQGSLWAETQKPEEASTTPAFDMSELESLFSASVPNSNHGRSGGKSSRASRKKPEKVNLIDLRRAYNCEIMLTKVKIPLSELMSSVLALDDSVFDDDQVENLIKFCPTKEEMELLQNYNGDKENLGKCEQFFLELMKVPRVESKLRVFSFKMQFLSQISDLRKSLHAVNCASEEIRNSVNLKRIMQTILSLGNALNYGTARGSAVGFRLDSLLKLTDTRARNNKMTLMHYLCKVLAKNLPELMDFPKDLLSLEAAGKIQLKYLAEEMQAISKGLEKVVQELAASENDGPVSESFCKVLKEFLLFAETEVKSLASLYAGVGRNADALALYFGEDPAKCPFEQVVSTLLNFVRMFVRAHDENCKQLEFEKKRAKKEAENEKAKLKASTNKANNTKMKKDDFGLPNT